MSTIGPGADSGALLAAQQKGAADGLRDRLKIAAERGDSAGIEKAAKQFEAFFVKELLQEMRKAGADESGLFGGQEMQTWQGLFDDEIAQRVSDGSGLGLADMIVREVQGGSAAAPRRAGLRRVSGAFAGAVSPNPAPVLGADSREGWSWPLPEEEPGRLSSAFGLREDPLGGGERAHAGLDLAAPAGTPVLAMAGGVVSRAGQAGGYGLLVEVDHGDGVKSLYAHQERTHVDVGDRVEAGQALGAVGSTGRATGSHLHLEVRVDGQAVDPAHWLRSQ